MKRAREHQHEQKDSKLGALEFASVINGDDPSAILSALGRFSRTIRREQRQALMVPLKQQRTNREQESSFTSCDSSDSEEHEDDDDDDMADETAAAAALSANKKPRKEETWMQDTGSFHVPFVGTSVAKGDTGTVVAGEWPTGLLKAYLRASPMAVELTSEGAAQHLIPPKGRVHKRLLSQKSKHGHRASQAIHRAFLDALAQVITATIPISTLQRDFGLLDGMTNAQYKSQPQATGTAAISTTTAPLPLQTRDASGIVSVILRERLDGIMALVNDETGGGKLMNRPLVASALHVLANLAATSLTAARQVARALDANLKDGILKSLLRRKQQQASRSQQQQQQQQQQPGQPSEQTQTTDKQTPAHGEKKDSSKNVQGKDRVGVQCLRLATVLAEWQDAAITSYITTKGSRERKVNAGILYLAVRIVLSDVRNKNRHDEEDDHDDEYFKAVTRLLRLLRFLLPDDADTGKTTSRRPLLSTRDLVDVFSNEALVNISQLALSFAPVLKELEPDRQSVSSSGDMLLDYSLDSGASTPMEVAGSESRKLLFLFLARPKQSPFLSKMRHSKADDRLGAQCAHQLVRAMVLLLQSSQSLPIQRFLIQCLKTTPAVVPHFFKVVPVPDPKQAFAFTARVGFLFRVVRESPPVSACIEINDRLDARQQAEQIVASIVPAHLKKHIMGKALQSPNALVVSETLKLLYALFDRYHAFDSSIEEKAGENCRTSFLADAIARAFPDLQRLLSVRSRFDPFGQEGDTKANTIVISHVCKVLDSFTLCLPNTVLMAKYDWLKLLPLKTGTFCSASSLLQFQMLQALSNILRLQQQRDGGHAFPTAGVRALLGIMMTTSLPPVYQKARSIVLQVLSASSPTSADTETRECIEYETSLWVDGLVEECVDDFCSMQSSPVNNGFRHGIVVAQAWKNACFDVARPPVCFSPLLTSALATIGSSSEPFALYICQVVTKCLLYQRHPLALAAHVVNALSGVNSDCRPVNILLQYSQRLLMLGAWDARECFRLLQTLLSNLFSPGCVHSLLMRSLQNEVTGILSTVGFSDRDIGVAVRQSLHILSVDSASSAVTERSLYLLRTLIPLVKRTRADIIDGHFDAVALHPLVVSGQFPWSEVAYLNTVALSFQGKDSTESEAHAFAIGDGNKGLGSSNGFLRNLLLFSFWNEFLSAPKASRTIGQILRLLCLAIANNRPLLVSSYSSLALYWIERIECNQDLSVVPLDAALETLRAIVERSEHNDTTTSLACYLEVLLSNALNAGSSKWSSLLYSMLLTSPPSVRFFIQSKRLSSRCKDRNSIRSRHPSLLSSLIVSDPVVFGTRFLDFLSLSNSEIDVPLLMDEGFFDDEFYSLSTSDELLTTEAFEKIRDMVVKRVMETLSVKFEERGAQDDMIAFVTKSGLLDSSHVDVFLEMACQSLKSKSKLRTVDDTWFRLSRSLLLDKKNGHSAFAKSNTRGRLASAVFTHAFQRLQSCLKNHLRPNIQGESGESVSSEACLEALNLASDLVLHRTVQDEKALCDEVSFAVTGALKASLKYGLAHADDEDDKISMRCFRLVRLLVVEASNPSSSLHVLESSCDLLNPSTIISLIVAHSHFHAVMTGAATEKKDVSSDNTALLELVRLVLVCTSMSRNVTLFESDVWASFLAVYNAGTTVLDMTVRRLTNVYLEKLEERSLDSNVPFLEGFKWKDVSPGADVSLKPSGWDWLVNGIDLSRIRATLSQFPVHDRIKADPIRDVEVWLNDSNIERKIPSDLSRSSNDDSSLDGWSSVDCDISLKDNLDDGTGGTGRNKRETRQEVDSWTGSGKDIRYSPAFLLPLILGALERSMANAGLSMSASMNYSRSVENGEDPRVLEFVLVAQRLCEKGALSLALCSLCGECSSLRKVAVSVLGHFKKALDANEARQLSTWRERPQLAMVVDSVQRGLAVRIAMRLDPNETKHGLIVPKLPALSAVFLARATLIVTKPDDPMFGPMNRYFLRLDNGHGAFQDTNRLPAFISLFCSSSGEPGQARRERLWAIQLLKDSFVEEYCYRMIDACHAPELLMSSLGSTATRQEDDQNDTERILLLETMTSLLQKGGRRATSHLVKRLCLLSWLRGLLVSQGLDEALPTFESRVSALRLLLRAISMARSCLTDDSTDEHLLLTESRMIFGSVVMLFDATVKDGLISEKDATQLDLFFTLLCQVLHALVRVLKDLDSVENSSAALDKYGVALLSGSRIMQMAPQHLKNDIVMSVCSAPLVHDDSITSKNVADFSKLTVSYLATVKEASVEMIRTILARVSLLMSLMKEQLGPESGVLDALLACRPNCLRTSRKEWFQCLESVVGKTDSSSSTEALRVGRAIINAPRK